jgi:CheY-like chemotaxis protein
MNRINNLWVVDDDEIYRFAINIIINRSGIADQISYFGNGQVAINTFIENMGEPEQLPDLILLDLNMPVLDGWQFLDAVSKLLPSLLKKVNIFLVSSSNDEEDFERARTLPEVIDMIVKPLTVKTLNEILTRVQQNKISC